MYQGAGSGIQNTQDGQGDCQEVDAHRKADVELDGLDRGIGQPIEVGKFGNVITHENNIGSIYGNIAAQTAHGDTNIGGLQRGSIVDTVTDHTDSLSALLNGAILLTFSSGKSCART